MSVSPDAGADQGPENLGPDYERARQRAEVLLDVWGRRLGSFATTVTSGMQKAVARAREEAEDIWAEAQTQAHSARKDSKSPPA